MELRTALARRMKQVRACVCTRHSVVPKQSASRRSFVCSGPFGGVVRMIVSHCRNLESGARRPHLGISLSAEAHRTYKNAALGFFRQSSTIWA